jgi:hypothetical protein
MIKDFYYLDQFIINGVDIIYLSLFLNIFMYVINFLFICMFISIYEEIEILSCELCSVGRTLHFIYMELMFELWLSYLFILRVKFLATRLFNKKNKEIEILTPPIINWSKQVGLGFDTVVNFLENHYNTLMRMWSKINSKLNTKLVEHKKLLQN